MLIATKAPQFLEGQIISVTPVTPLGGARTRRIAVGREVLARQPVWYQYRQQTARKQERAVGSCHECWPFMRESSEWTEREEQCVL